MIVELRPAEIGVVLQGLQDLAAVGLHQQADLDEGVLRLRVAQRHLAKELPRVRRAVEAQRADRQDGEQQHAENADDESLDLDVGEHGDGCLDAGG